MRASQSYFPSGSHLCLADHTSPTKSSGCIQIDHAAQHQPSSQSPMIFMQHPGCNATAHGVHMQSVAHGQHQDGYFTTMNASQDRGGYGPLTPGTVSQSVSYAFSQDPLAPTPNMRSYTGPSEPVRGASEPYGQGQMPVFVHENTFDASKSNLHDLDVIQGRALFWAPPVRYRQRIAQACECCRKRKSKCSGEKPKCMRCSTRSLECVYAEDHRLRKNKAALGAVVNPEPTMPTLVVTAASPSIPSSEQMPVPTPSYPAITSSPTRRMTSSSSFVLPPSAVFGDFAPPYSGQVQYIPPGSAFCPVPPMVQDGQHAYTATGSDLCGSGSFISPSSSMYCEMPRQNAQLPNPQHASPHRSHISEHMRSHQMSRANSAPASPGPGSNAHTPYARHPEQHVSPVTRPPLFRAATSPAQHSTASGSRDGALSYRYYHPYGGSFANHPPSTESVHVRSQSQPGPIMVRSDSVGHAAMSGDSSFSSQASAQEIASMFSAYTTEDDYIGGEFQHMFHHSFSLGS